MSQTVIGVFASNDQARKAVSALKSAGFSDAHIDLSAREGAADYKARHNRVEGFFSSLFSDHDEKTRNNYMETARRGTVVTVHTSTMQKAEQAADILDQHGAIDANDASTHLRKRGIDVKDADTTLEVIKEDLMVGKKEVSTGGVRMRSRIVSKPVTEQIRLREEEVVVSRKPVDRPATDRDFNTFKEGTVTMTETAEVPVVQKSARVVEEVSIGKKAKEHTETIKENVRETKVDVERVAGQTTTTKTATTARNKDQSLKDKLDRDNDGELVDLTDNDGRIG